MAERKRKTPAERILETGTPWPAQLNVDAVYQRLHDDTDGEDEGKVIVSFSCDGDVWLSTDRHRGSPLRFRSGFGGSHSPRVYNALVLLALAIRLDEEDDRKRGGH